MVNGMRASSGSGAENSWHTGNRGVGRISIDDEVCESPALASRPLKTPIGGAVFVSAGHSKQKTSWCWTISLWRYRETWSSSRPVFAPPLLPNASLFLPREPACPCDPGAVWAVRTTSTRRRKVCASSCRKRRTICCCMSLRVSSSAEVTLRWRGQRAFTAKPAPRRVELSARTSNLWSVIVVVA